MLELVNSNYGSNNAQDTAPNKNFRIAGSGIDGNGALYASGGGTSTFPGGTNAGAAVNPNSFLLATDSSIGVETGSTLVISDDISDPRNPLINPGGSTFGLTKVGGGTLILQGASSYHGETIVAGGTLLINTQRDAITKRINLVDAPAPASPVLIPPSYNAGTGLTQFQLTQAIDTSGLSVGATVGNSILTAMNTSQNVFLFGEDATTAMTIVSPAGDFNADFYVDAADYAIWRKDPNVGSYDDWRNNFGSGPEGEVTFQGIDRGLYFWNDGTENNLVTVQSGATLGGTGKILGTHVDVLSGGTLAPAPASARSMSATPR
jgi:autotransporter-associated beta strand protein